MSKKSEEFLQKMLEFLPESFDAYEESVSYFGEVLDVIIMEDIIMVEMFKLLRSKKDNKLVEDIFQYLEKACNYEDIDLHNLISVTVLEKLWEKQEISELSQKYMGPKTKQLFAETVKSVYGVQLT